MNGLLSKMLEKRLGVVSRSELLALEVGLAPYSPANGEVLVGCIPRFGPEHHLLALADLSRTAYQRIEHGFGPEVYRGEHADLLRVCNLNSSIGALAEIALNEMLADLFSIKGTTFEIRAGLVVVCRRQ